MTPPQAVEKFRWLLDQSVQKQLIADVPVGIFLSGGLDSSTIVAIAKKYNQNLTTLSFGFGGNKSELPFAREVATRYRTNHIELHESEFKLDDLLMKMQDIYDEPFADSSNIPTYLVAKSASEHIKVVMGGDGGDELLAGYSSWYKPLLYLQPQMENPHPIFKFVAYMLHVFMQQGLPIPSKYSEQIGKLDLFMHAKSVQEAHNIQNQYFHPAELEKLGLKHWKPDYPQARSNSFDDALRMDILDYLPGDILVKTDRATMAHGLELRTPFLDVNFAELCIALPYVMKISRQEDKKILRHAFASQWPPSINKRKKQGFGAPVGKWLQTPKIMNLRRDFLSDPKKKIHSILNSRQLSGYIAKNNYKTWSLLVLSLWLEKHRFDLI